jgi:Spy/CpxP family protein refolding chaperone
MTPESQSLAYRAYVRLLRQLHRLIAEGAGDSLAADDVREAMEMPWSQLTQQEVEAANQLSALLYDNSTTDEDTV